MSLFALFIICRAHFSMPNSIPISKLYILIVCICLQFFFFFLFFFFFCKHFSVVYVHQAINLFMRFSKFVSPSAHLKYLSCIIAITNSYGDTHIPGRCLSGFSTLLKCVLLLTIPLSPFFMAFVKNFLTLSDISYIFRQSTIQLCGMI